LNVFNLIGISGTGKTTVMELLHFDDIQTIKLHSLVRTSNYFGLDYKLVTSKWNYIANWYNSILACHNEGIRTIISDRSPIEVCGYATKGKMLLEALLESSEELELHYGVKLINIYLETDLQIAFQRLIDRTKYQDDTHYEHDKYLVLKKVRSFFEKNKSLWHYHIKNENLDKTVKKVKQIIIDETNKQAKS